MEAISITIALQREKYSESLSSSTPDLRLAAALHPRYTHSLNSK